MSSNAEHGRIISGSRIEARLVIDKSTCPRYFDNPPDAIEDRTQSILDVLEEGGEVKKREQFILSLDDPAEGEIIERRLSIIN